MIVLIADPDAEVCTEARRALDRFGYRSLVATTQQEAVALLTAQRPDVAFVALTLPGLDLFAFCQAARGDDRDRPKYVVVLLSADDGEGLHGAMLAGADDFLMRPFLAEQLHARLQVAERLVLLSQQVLDQRTELDRVGRALTATARTDALTQLGNDRQLRDDLSLFHGQLRRYGHRYAAARLDLDHFSEYSATYGQLAGDEALRVLAETIIQRLRTGDRAYRHHSTEVVVLFPEQTADSARIAVERIREGLVGLGIPHAENPPWRVLTLSAGIAAFGQESANVEMVSERLLGPAHAALERARQLGGNRVIVDGPASSSSTSGLS